MYHLFHDECWRDRVFDLEGPQLPPLPEFAPSPGPVDLPILPVVRDDAGREGPIEKLTPASGFAPVFTSQFPSA